MSLRSLLDLILRNENLTRGLEDPEARLLIEWFVEQIETRHANEPCEEHIRNAISKQCRRARAIARFVSLWCFERAFGAAMQLAATERFAWPLPTQPMEAYDLMDAILFWESQQAS